MNCLFVNGSSECACGVNQYGKNLYAILEKGSAHRWSYCEPDTVGQLRAVASMQAPDCVLYNFQDGQHSFLNDAPFSWLKRQIACYHDGRINEDRFDAILFSDPTMTPRSKWHVIGRPLPQFENHLQRFVDSPPHETPVIGCHGFLGAWADQVVCRVLKEFEYATIRLSLPYARYGDADGASARGMAERCRNMVKGHRVKGYSGIVLQISHDFLEMDDLLAWLATNDMNCYIRPADMNWRGVSSAPDAALAANRPIAINKCNAFRHLHHLSPSICVEDSSLLDIFASGLSPLIPFKKQWCDPEKICEQIDKVINTATT